MKYVYNNREIFPTVEVYHDIIPYLSGVGMKDFFTDKEKCAYAWKTAEKILKNCFGDLFPMRKPSPPPNSYGHLICIGAPVSIPDDGEPNISPFARSVDEAIEILKGKKGRDFSENEMFQRYLDTWDYLKKYFPEENIPFTGFNSEGPLTSAVLMRGQDFFYDIYDEPGKSKEFLRLLTESVIDYVKLCRRINGKPEIQDRGNIADDFASLIPPAMWDEFVIPFWNQMYEGLGGGKERFVHVENLVPLHLKYLKNAGITHYQPSVSGRLTLEDIKEYLDPGISFDWMLYAFHITEMTDKQIEDWVEKTVRAGVTSIRTQCGAFTHQRNKMDRIAAFFRAFEKYAAS
jgi:uroporphyrinogen-III decarboxylase